MQELEDVFQYLLSDRFEPEAQQRIKREAAQQIRYSIRRFATELHVYAGYSQKYAAKVAEQIVPKPVLYSMVIEYRTSGEYRLPDFDSAPPGQQEAYRSLQYELLAPSFIAFLYDQTIDDFNMGLWEDTLIEREVHNAAQHLPVQADYYQQKIAALLAFCLECGPAAPPIHTLPADLVPYWVLAPHIAWLVAAGIDHDEIADILYTVGDVLTHEHMAQLAHNPDRRRYARPMDFVDCVSGVLGANKYDSSPHATARAILRGQGYLMVSVSQYVLFQLAFWYDTTHEIYVTQRISERPHTPVREMLRRFPGMINLMRLYELIVRVGDDAGDILLDTERGAPNWVNFSHEGLDAFMVLASLYDVEDDNMSDFIAAMLRAISAAMTHASDRRVTARQIMAQLQDLVQVLLLLTLSTTSDLLEIVEERRADTPDMVEDSRKFIGIMYEVVFGSLVNAQFNDQYAEEMGAGMRPAA